MTRNPPSGPFSVDKHGLPDPLTLGVRTQPIVDFGILCGEYQYSKMIDRAPKGAEVQWEPLPVDPYPDDGREYRRCVSGFHQGSQWVPLHLMTRRGVGYGSYCLACNARRVKLQRRTRGLK